MPESTINRAQSWSEALLDELVACGHTTVCLSPGSRSTPLVAAAVRHPDLEVVAHVDERGSAFFCLGYGRATGRAAVWITTSGTAVANGLPAVVEAAMDGVPMILLTADRPPELLGTGANQTIDQKGIFGSHVRYQIDLPVPDAAADMRLVRDTVNLAVAHAASTPAGPVHINCPFRKPLEPDWSSELIRVSGPTTSYAKSRRIPEAGALAKALSGITRGVILAGRMDPETASRCAEMARSIRWPMICDVNSQLKLGAKDPWVITHGDLMVGAELPRPDAVIQVGRAPVSQRVAEFLADPPPAVWAVLADGTTRIDPQHRVTHRLADAATACEVVSGLDLSPLDPRFVQAWLRAQERVADALAKEVLGAGLTEPAVAVVVAEEIPDAHGLVLGSSMPVRDMDTFAGKGNRPKIVVANRGASGIDGTISTAAGVTRGLGAPVTLLIGDQTFLHDLNGLALAGRENLTIVLINNDGGGIFSFLPIASRQDLFEPYFGAAHGMEFSAAARLFKIDYCRADSIDTFRSAYRNAVETSGASIIEVSTNRDANHAEHGRLRAAVASWLC